jgi:ABC-type dipeptide/oligopeptide/nickel transport system ATPase component
MAMIFQEPMTALNPLMTGGRQIGESAGRPQAECSGGERRKARIIEVLSEVHLPDAAR